MSAVSRSDSAAATFEPSRYAAAETAVCALMQNSHSFAFETNAAINSRSPTDHAEGPRIASWVSAFMGVPKNSGRYMTSLTTSGIGCRDTTRVIANRIFVPKGWPLSRIESRMVHPLLVAASRAEIAASY